jgi:hypothetical protein
VAQTVIEAAVATHSTAAVSRFRIDLRFAALAIAVVATLVRCRVFGDPVIQIDEQFYLLVGGRMLHGVVPYVDIWDRKPIGLFLLYAGFRALGGSGVLTYQIGALISVWATALILFAMARRIAPPGGALTGAVLYVLWLDLCGGEGGQSPVFYTLPVVAAIAIVFFGRATASARRGDMRLPGTTAMLLFGIAMQIKYTAVFEGMFAGVMLLAISRGAGRRWPALLVDATLWIGCALAPTVIAAGSYAAIGHFGDWWFANVTSIAMRGAEAPKTVAERIRVMAYLVVPLIACVPLRCWIGAPPSTEQAGADRRFLDAWAAVALLGVVLFGTWFNHYVLPLCAPLSVVAAPLWSRRAGRLWLLVLAGASFLWGQRIVWHHQITRGDGRILAHAAATMAGSQGCAFVYDGYPAFYDVTNSCLLTTRAFSAHLQARNEMGATGIDEATEVRRVMALRPERVMVMAPAYDEENPVARAEVLRVLRRDYQPMYGYTAISRTLLVYGLKGTVHTAPVFEKPGNRQSDFF